VSFANSLPEKQNIDNLMPNICLSSKNNSGSNAINFFYRGASITFILHMKQFFFFNVLLLSSITAMAQSKQNNYGEYKKNADSLLTTIIDKGVFIKYVRFRADKSYYINDGNSADQKVSFLKQVDWDPDFYTFSYDFSHPGFSGHRFPIAITLDRFGKFAPQKHFCGFVIIPDSLDAIIVSKEMAIKSLKDDGPRNKAYPSRIQLVWFNSEKKEQVYASVRELAELNSIKWRVRGTVLFRDEKKYRGYFLVDALTGSIGRHFAIPWD
jgi:hypothetical protein